MTESNRADPKPADAPGVEYYQTQPSELPEVLPAGTRFGYPDSRAVYELVGDATLKPKERHYKLSGYLCDGRGPMTGGIVTPLQVDWASVPKPPAPHPAAASGQPRPVPNSCAGCAPQKAKNPGWKCAYGCDPEESAPCPHAEIFPGGTCKRCGVPVSREPMLYGVAKVVEKPRGPDPYKRTDGYTEEFIAAGPGFTKCPHCQDRWNFMTQQCGTCGLTAHELRAGKQPDALNRYAASRIRSALLESEGKAGEAVSSHPPSFPEGAYHDAEEPFASHGSSGR